MTPAAGRRGLRAFAEICVVSAAYAALTILLAPISYTAVQFRVAEVLKPLVIWRPHLVAAFVVGNVLSNLTSPHVGPWELVFMPVANLVGATACVIVGRRFAYVGAALYAVIIATAVALMLSALLKTPFAVLWPPLLLSELVLIVGGVPIMRRIQDIVSATIKL
ncbi:MAG: QueT transporter family protein [Armatimonadota bacterium]|nr:QueT transporter family protein [Armatimonadota bacterium]